jgi:hypothetical protein
MLYAETFGIIREQLEQGQREKRDMRDSPRPQGRPRHYPKEPKRFPLAIRTTASLKHALVQACEASGRSLTQEIEYRLWRSFDGSEFLAPENHLAILLDSALGDFEKRLLALLDQTRAQMSSARTDLPDDLRDGDREPKD